MLAQQQQQQQQQQEEFMRQQMAMQEQQRQQEEWARQQFLAQQQQSLLAQPTGYGSNNPFAPGGGMSAPQQNPSPQPSSFLPVPVVSQQIASPQPQQQNPLEPQQTAKPFQPPPPKDDGQHAGLAALLARGREDGLDTFGNVGNLREFLLDLLKPSRTDDRQVSPSDPRSINRTGWRCSKPARQTARVSAETTLSANLSSSKSKTTSRSSLFNKVGMTPRSDCVVV
jgi:hypothetical protein